MKFKILQKISNILKSGTLIPISSDPYSTHMPALVALGVIFKPRQILEYGSGINSTRLFLNNKAFPELSTLKSFENYPEWYKTVSDVVGNDSRIIYKLVEGQMSNHVFLDDVKDADLIFIDDSYHASDRAATIAAVLKCNPNLCVIHDFENFPYRRAASRYSQSFRLKSLLPNTGIIGSNLDIKLMHKIDNIINLNKSIIKNDDILNWRHIFESNL